MPFFIYRDQDVLTVFLSEGSDLSLLEWGYLGRI